MYVEKNRAKNFLESILRIFSIAFMVSTGRTGGEVGTQVSK